MDEKVILLVEDNPSDINLARRALAKSQVVSGLAVAWDGEEALDYLLAPGDPGSDVPRALPALILLDLKLPKLDGFSVLLRIRSEPRTRMIPVVVLTTSTETADLRRAYQLGANSYVRKPVSFERFIETIRHLGDYWLTLNEAPPAPD